MQDKMVFLGFTPHVGSRGGNIGRGKPLPEECQGSGMLEKGGMANSKPPVAQSAGGIIVALIFLSVQNRKPSCSC